MLIQVAIIGVGAISDSHMEGFAAFPEYCRIAALVDRMPERAAKKAAWHHLDGVSIYSSIDEMVTAEETITLASICLPPSLHCETAVKLLERGIHVLCEKPLAPTLEECDRMLAAAERGGAILSAVAQNRFKADVVKAKKLVDSGILGKTYFAQVYSLWWRGTNYYNLEWRGRWETEGGGCTMIHGIHHIDLFLWLMGDVESVAAAAGNQAHDNSEVEDISMSMVRFKSGAMGSVVCSILHHGEEQRLILDSEWGSVGLPLQLHANRQMENGFPEENMPLLTRMQSFCDNITLEYTGHQAQIKDVLEAIREGRPPLVTGVDGRRAIEFITAVYQSAFTGKTVFFPVGENDPFYSKAGFSDSAVRYYEKTVSVAAFNNDKIQVGGSL